MDFSQIQYYVIYNNIIQNLIYNLYNLKKQLIVIKSQSMNQFFFLFSFGVPVQKVIPLTAKKILLNFQCERNYLAVATEFLRQQNTVICSFILLKIWIFRIWFFFSPATYNESHKYWK